MNARICLLPGDGIGPEILAQGVAALKAVARKFGHDFTFEDALIGGAAVDACGEPLPQETVTRCLNADAVTRQKTDACVHGAYSPCWSRSFT